MRIPLIAGNWKMHMGGGDAITLSREIRDGIGEIDGVEILLCPPFTALRDVHKVIKDSRIKLGAQNCFYEQEGAYTGEVSPLFLVDMGCEYVIVGHSERRKYFNESDEVVGKKLKSAIDAGLHTILCVGEQLKEREEGKAESVVKKQLLGSLSALSLDYINKIVIAYEPVWAIGTGRTCEPDIAEGMHRFIRTLIGEKFGNKVAGDVRILYGGSIKPDNIASIIEKEDIDGGLIGGASIKSKSFIEIIKNSKN